ncbi:rap1 GTPase-GDP dissociation stimulator 1 isoform X2 [Zootermopsis nevadensis]|nr:rap1 GTPase-GDP dissociation stimulator 1 isoform X2 [Zootermopsis nevadensis]
MEGLVVAVENKSDDISDILDSLVSQIQVSGSNCGDCSSFVTQLETLLQWESKATVARAAQVVAELAKSESGRENYGNIAILKILVELIKTKEEDLDILTQVCRALGNICYDNDKGRKFVLDTECLPDLLGVLERSVNETGERGRTLRNVAAGFLLNLLIGQEDIQEKAIELGVTKLLCSVLELDGTVPEGEEASTHVLLILGLLTDSVSPCDSLLDEKLCQVTVRVLGVSSSPEVSELCLELLHGQAENENVKNHLAHAGLCELLVQLLEKHKPLVDDDETRNLMKMACDLIVLILTGDVSMNALYAEGKGKVFQQMVAWLSSGDEDLQITGVLAMGNFARTDKHCIQMVEAGVSKKLLALVEKNNKPSGDIRLQHALLSALRNLVIPRQNKAMVLEDGLVDAVYPMLAIPTFPVVFKLLGTLRMVIDGQESAACKLGRKKDLVTSLVTWCGTEDHPGVQGEANRLLAWLIKNSKDQEVLTTILESGAVPYLVDMLIAEHAVMQNEALLALTLLVTMRLTDAEANLLEAKIGDKLTTLLNDFGPSLTCEMVQNILSLVDQLTKSGVLLYHLVNSGVSRALSKLSSEENVTSINDQITQLTSMLDSG